MVPLLFENRDMTVELTSINLLHQWHYNRFGDPRFKTDFTIDSRRPPILGILPEHRYIRGRHLLTLPATCFFTVNSTKQAGGGLLY